MLYHRILLGIVLWSYIYQPRWLTIPSFHPHDSIVICLQNAPVIRQIDDDENNKDDDDDDEFTSNRDLIEGRFEADALSQVTKIWVQCIKAAAITQPALVRQVL